MDRKERNKHHIRRPARKFRGPNKTNTSSFLLLTGREKSVLPASQPFLVLKLILRVAASSIPFLTVVPVTDDSANTESKIVFVLINRNTGPVTDACPFLKETISTLTMAFWSRQAGRQELVTDASSSRPSEVTHFRPVSKKNITV